MSTFVFVDPASSTSIGEEETAQKHQQAILSKHGKGSGSKGLSATGTSKLTPLLGAKGKAKGLTMRSGNIQAPSPLPQKQGPKRAKLKTTSLGEHSSSSLPKQHSKLHGMKGKTSAATSSTSRQRKPKHRELPPIEGVGLSDDDMLLKSDLDDELDKLFSAPFEFPLKKKNHEIDLNDFDFNTFDKELDEDEFAKLFD